MTEKDTFKDLTFSGAPSEYRLFRRKVLLSVASLEEKHVRLAGPRILSRLTGEAWRATEHLAIGELRTEKGWLAVLKALDEHYRYQRVRGRAVLSRLETLVAAEKRQQRGSTKRRRAKKQQAVATDGDSTSSSFSSDHAEDDEEPRLTKDKVEEAAASASASARPAGEPAGDSKGPRTVGSFVGSPSRKPPSADGGSQRSRGTQKADDERANRRMMESLETLEVGHLKVKPIFPEVILGHLFMRKYGLNREQRGQVIRSTGGSCKFKDIERVIRASDYEDKMQEQGGRGQNQRPGRAANVLAAEEDSSLSELSGSDEIHEAAEDSGEEDEDDEELEEAYEIQKKAKDQAKKAYRSYKDSRRKVREIKKDRQPYMPVVALPPQQGHPTVPEGMPVQPTFKYDRKPTRKGSGRQKGGRKDRREDVHMVSAEHLSEFCYMVATDDAAEMEFEIYAVTVPAGQAVIDTGCTTSVIGAETAQRYIEFFRDRGLPEPTPVDLPPVQLKGFNGVRTSSEKGLRWLVKLGQLWGQVTTYLVDGQAPFLLSRRVLQNMEATIDMGKCTLTSHKHGIFNEPLSQASNGHLLLPLVPPDESEELLQVQDHKVEAVRRVPFQLALAALEEQPDQVREELAGIHPTQGCLVFLAVKLLDGACQTQEGTAVPELTLGPAYEVDFDFCAFGFKDKVLASRDEEVVPSHDIFMQTDDEADSERESDEEGDREERPALQEANKRSYAAMIQKLHVNTGHASVPQMLRLAQRAKAPAGLIAEIRKFKCPICEELQVELKRDGPAGVVEQKYNVLTAVDYATDFAQQIVLPSGPGVVSRAFHALWCRPYGPPKIVYVDPDQRWMSGEFQGFLRNNSITLLDSATESHWQLGRVEIAQRVLRNMAQRVWKTAERPAEEVIESSLADLTEQRNLAAQSAVLSETDFAQKMQVRHQAAEAFLESHAHDTWARAIRGRNRPIRGPYTVGQSVYVFRKQGKGQFSTRHGTWLGPGRVVGTESFREDSPVPRVVWVVINGFMYKCSPECLRPVAEDEVTFRQLAQQFSAGHLPEEMEQVTPSRRGPAGRFFDITSEIPAPEDFLSPTASDEEGGEQAEPNPEQSDRNVRRRITHNDDYWMARATGTSPRGLPTVREREAPADLGDDVEHPADKAPRLTIPEDHLSDYSPSVAEAPEPSSGSAMQDVAPSPSEEVPPNSSDPAPLLNDAALCCEVAFDVFDLDLDPEGPGLWGALEECATVASRPGQKRRVEVSFRRLNPGDREKFKGAMKKEWQSWLENKVTTVVKNKGIPKSRIIGSRWVLTWKKSSDPDDRSLSAKARLVLVGFQDPDLGRIATDSPTLRKESKHIILSICASMGWVIWGADIKTAFLSGDASNRDLFFKPPPEVSEFMNLGPEDVLRLEKAAYGLAEAPRAWFLRLTRELLAVGLVVSQLDPCVFCLRAQNTLELLGVCGVHVDDLLGGGTQAMDRCLAKLRLKLPFGDFRKKTIKYTGAEIRQLPDFSIEVTQEAYVDKLEEVSTKPFGKGSEPLNEPSLMRACCGQLAWVANHSRPDQAFLASYLQGTQDKALVSHLELYNKAVREMKTRKACLRFPPVPVDRWRLLVVTDAGWGVRANGESQGGLLLCLCDRDVLEQKPGKTWIIEWASKKLRRVVRSSTAAETLAAQNGLDAVEFAQAFLQEILFGMSPRQFQQWVPEHPSGLVIDSKSLYDALTRSACSSALAMEKRLAIDYAIARACLQERNVRPFWTNNLQMISDCLTKLRGNKDILFRVLDTCNFHVRPSKESGRKESARQKGPTS
ncbi:RE1 [Symbiodinium sp. CCMP2592]|nr:RE1 [Symbiodinium sp. CCMP2592]